ncbi:aldolase/citrate lyase family protein [Jatrophihabitans sp. DSM 45814]
MTTRSKLVQALAAGQAVFGAAIPAGDISGAQRMGDSNFDFAMVDMEHEGFDFPNVGDTLQWLISRRRALATGNVFAGPTPILRLPHTAADTEIWIAQQALDYGVLGIVLPYAETAEQVERMVRALRYPRVDSDGVLRGERRVWPKAAIRYWGCSSFEEYHEFADLWPAADGAEIVLIAMVATPLARANIEEIAAVPGLSGILFGAKHAWSAMGRWGKIDLEHPDLVEFRTAVLAACLRNSIIAGCSTTATPPSGSTVTVDEDFAQRRIEDGFRFFLTQGPAKPELF